MPIRLVTFRQLLDVDTAELNAFSSGCSVFENHYLQRPGYGSLTPDDSRPPFAELLSSGALSTHYVSVRDPRQAAADIGVSPAVHHAVEPDSRGDRLANELADCQTEDFVWIDIDWPPWQSSAAVLADVLTAIRDAFRSNPGDLLITVLSVDASPLPEPFTSLLPEHHIRVPLWLHRPEQPGGSIQAVTGSWDIPLSVNQRLNPSADGDSQNFANIFDLVTSPGTELTRNLPIERTDCRAVRTSDFLFVRRQPTEPHEFPEEGLYTKPDDVWNVHDVSGEYLEVVSDLSADATSGAQDGRSDRNSHE